MPTYTNTAKYLLRRLTGSNVISDIDAGIAALADDVDSKFAGYSEGPIGSRPTSTGGTPGIAGRIYRTNDSPVAPIPGGRYYLDNGTGWDLLVRVIANGTVAWNPGSIAHGATATTTVTATGAAVGDVAVVAFTTATAGVLVTGTVTGANTVTVSMLNATGGAFDAASGTVNVYVLRL